MNPEHIETGKQGETLAADYLEKKGFIILDRNYRFGPNEIDLICLDGNELVFVEVKTRTKHSREQDTVFPENAVTKAKQQSCFKVADAYIYERKMLTVPVRFDVISIRVETSHEPEIILFRDAFRDDHTLQEDINIL